MDNEDANPPYNYSVISELNRTMGEQPVTTQPTNRGRKYYSNVERLTEEFQLLSLDLEQYPGNRRPIPVSTLDWQSTNQSQFLTLNGLDFLIGANKVLIQQTVELGDMMTTIESENRYVVKIPDGENLYRANEFSTPLTRLVCGSKRPFNMTLMDHTHQQALTLSRRTAFSMCCFPCIRQDIQVTVPPGEFIGSVQQEWTLVVPLFLVRNFNDDVIYMIEGPRKKFCCGDMEAEFKILSADTMTELGTIIHGWDIQSSNYNMVLTFPTAATDPKLKALLIGAAFLIEYVFFVTAKSTKCMTCIC